jgi:ferredoxin-NADP reductase
MSDDYHLLAVDDVVAETADARSFVLGIPPDLAETFRYRAGQFCTFRAEIGGEPVVRSYSMSSSPDVGDRFTVTVKRVAGGKMSSWMNDALRPGAQIEAMRPAGLFVLRDALVPIVAFAGGSGITPILSIVKTALATTAREIRLVYANRDPASVIFAAELERLRAASGGRFSVHHHHDSERGFLDAAACAAHAGEQPHADFYLCGPAPYMEIVEDGLAQRRVAPARIFVERFEVPEVHSAAAAPASETESLVIRLDRRRHTVRYEPGDTILHAARRAGLSAPFSCERGNCATCIAQIVEGKVTMRANNALTPEEVESGLVLTCQAVPMSRSVVVDYDQ